MVIYKVSLHLYLRALHGLDHPERGRARVSITATLKEGMEVALRSSNMDSSSELSEIESGTRQSARDEEGGMETR